MTHATDKERLLVKLINSVYRDLDGNALRQAPQPGMVATENDPELTVAKSLVQACLSAAPNGGAYPADKAAARFVLSLELHKAQIDEEIEVPSDLIADLKGDVLRLYAPIVGGQFVHMLDGSKK